MKLGFAGNLARNFLNSKLTPLFVLFSLFLGVMAVFLTPREEEPQIKVPMIDILIPVPGYSAREVEKRVTTPLERRLIGLPGIKHVYSTSMSGAAFITARFKVGEDLEASLVKIHHKVDTFKYDKPPHAMSHIIKSYTIDDVPFYAITFSSNALSSSEIRRKIVPLAKELQAIEGISEKNIIGGQQMVVKITPDLKKMNELGITLLEMKQATERSSSQFIISPLRDRTPETLIAAGSFLKSVEDVENIPLGRRFGKTIQLSDVAGVKFTTDEETSRVYHGKDFEKAVTVVYTKKKGTNATLLAEKLKNKLDVLTARGSLKDLKIEITRDYGKTAGEKSDELLEHLVIATVSVMILIALMMGLRVSLVVGIAVPVTLAITLLIYYLLGYTLNRVTLFALIFSIGILVDDAIVVVENIYRHLSQGFHKAKDMAITIATDEVGNPTILATFTVIAAIMPMAFVGGLMGPYMKPIPIGASIAMVFSLFIAFVISPWATKKLVKKITHKEENGSPFLRKIFTPLMDWMLKSWKNTAIALSLVGVLLLGSVSMIGLKLVKVKMLPFDNKSEFQVLVDLPPGSTLNETEAFMKKMVEKLYTFEEVSNVQTYIGTAAPFNFSGMVKHTFMREKSYMADLQVNLLEKSERKLQSHDIVKKIRKEIVKDFSGPGIKIKFLEIPPGPPVLSTLLGEIYHPDREKQAALLKQVEGVYRSTEGVIEVDTTLEPPQEILVYDFDRKKGMVSGVPQNFATNTLMMALGKLNLFPLHVPDEEEPVFMRMGLSKADKKSDKNLGSLLVPSLEGDKIPLSTLMRLNRDSTDTPIHHKDLNRVMYVMGEVSGKEESPIYVINKMEEKLGDFEIMYSGKPEIIDRPILKWDGEMDITVEVFRDLGIAFLIAVILIMALVIGWYNSFIIPLIIMLPVPLSLVGIILGHWAFDAFFTATSMIGFIALAGITVRNSILLVDFIELNRHEGCDCKKAVVESVIVRFRPIMLTALAVIVAALVILYDPIFQGLAISLMMGSIASALLSIPIVPLLYYWFRRNSDLARRKNPESGFFDSIDYDKEQGKRTNCSLQPEE